MPKSKQALDDKAEWKKEFSRTAAKSRRLLEAELFSDLAKTLPPIDLQTIYQMDRLAVLRLILARYRLRKTASTYLSNSDIQETTDHKFVFLDNDTIAQCLEGFIMIINKTGRLLFVTTSVADCLGFTQADLIGRHLRDYVEADDWPRFSVLCETGKTELEEDETFVRIKTALTVRGGLARKLTVAVNEPLRAYVLNPVIRPNRQEQEIQSLASWASWATKPNHWLPGRRDENIRLIYCLPFDLSSTRRGTNETSLREINTRHEMDMKFRSCEQKFANMLNIKNPKSYYKKSFYDMVHPSDLKMVCRCFKQMLNNGHSVSGYYRIMSQDGRYLWIMTEMLLFVQNIRGNYQKSVVCKHTFLGTDNAESDVSINSCSTMLPVAAVSISDTAFTQMNTFETCNAQLLQSCNQESATPFLSSFGDPFLVSSSDLNHSDSHDNPSNALSSSADTDFESSSQSPSRSIEHWSAGLSTGLSADLTSHECQEETNAVLNDIFLF